MTERPILFNTEMVKAVLAGRKTQTRRVVKPQPERHHWEILRGYKQEARLITTQDGLNVKFIDSIPDGTMNARREDGPLWVKCPYGQVGDRLWVQEGYQIKGGEYPYIVYGNYLLDNQYFEVNLTEREWLRWMDRKKPFNKTPGRFMYKSLSRINLEITNIRVERVQDISEKDAKAEGLTFPDIDWSMIGKPYVAHFHKLWDAINEKRGYGWEVNPWVWVVEFKVVKEGI